jgi:flagellar biosynthetic protein FlhB
MADDDQEKTEQPTGKRLQQAKEKGQVPRSKEAGTATVLLAGIIGLLMLQTQLSEAVMNVFQRCFHFERSQVFDPNSMYGLIGTSIGEVLWPLFILFSIVTIASLIGNIALGGFHFNAEAIIPKFTKLNPVSGLKRMIGVMALVELIKSIAKVGFVAWLAYLQIMSYWPDLMRLSHEQLATGIVDALHISLKVGIGICCALLPVVLIDVPFQKWNHIKQLRMTKQEIKDEYKDSEGKPEVKGRLRQMQREMANRRMMAEVPKADVIVTNPTHYAVALKYDRFKPGAAPVVVAKGTDEIAMKIREIADEYKMPILQSPALARAIYHTTKLDKEIPDGLFQAVALILAYVFQLKAYQAGRGAPPRALPKDNEMPIPNDLRH